NGSIRSFPTLPQFLVPVSHVLGAHPEVRVNQVSWQATDEPKTLPKMPYSAPRNAPPVKAVTRTQDAAGAASEDAANPPFAGERRARREARLQRRGIACAQDRMGAPFPLARGGCRDRVGHALVLREGETRQRELGEAAARGARAPGQRAPRARQPAAIRRGIQ